MKSRTWMWTLLVWFFAALAIPAQARIVYTPVNVTLPASGYYPIDLNHDGITDFYIETSSLGCFDGRVIYALYITLPLGGEGVVGTYYPYPLPSGETVDSSRIFWGSTALMYREVEPGGPGCGPEQGHWHSVYRGYLGLKFLINGQTHYGWVELSTNGETGVDTLYGFAYETIAFKGILTGQTMDSPDEPAMDSGSAESTVPGPIASVAPPLSAAPQLQSSGDTSAAIPVGMAVQDNPSQDRKSKHQRYKLIDLGTFGGPNNVGGGVIPPGPNQLTNQGTVVAGADTSTPDPNCFIDCFVNHAYRFREGVLEDLGTLPGINLSSYATDISPNGRRIVGVSENGTTDPLTGFQESSAKY